VDREDLGSPNVYGNDRVIAISAWTPRPTPRKTRPSTPSRRPANRWCASACRISTTWARKCSAGDRHRHRWRHYRHRRLQSAGRGSQQDRNQKAHQRVRSQGFFAARNAVLRGRWIGTLLPTIKTPRAQRWFAGRGPEKASGSHQSRRLLRCIGLRPHERAKRQDHARPAYGHSRQKESCHRPGFGPRFLHSTGQAYKGGPNSGVFIQITTTTPKTSRCRIRNTLSVWCRTRKLAGISRCSRSAAAAPCASISAPTSTPA